MADQEEENVNFSSSNAMYQDATFLQYRLNTDDLIKQLETTLSGKITNYFINDQNEVVEKSVMVTEPKVNKDGFTAIVNYVRSHVNNQTVQGNFKEDRYNDLIATIREDFAMIVCINQYKWEIKNNYYQYIVDTVMDMIKIFLSRTLDNKERESYNTMERSTQVSRSSQKGWGIR